MNKKRKGYIVICIIILLLFSYWILRYNSLERRLILGNVNHLFYAKVEQANINKKTKIINIEFKEYAVKKERYKIIKDIENNCIKTIQKKKSYDGYKVILKVIKSSCIEYAVTFDENMEAEYLDITPMSNRDIDAFNKIIRNHPNVRVIRIDNYISSNSEECCKIDNYNEFENLEKIQFVKKPSDEIIKYLREQVPQCEIEF